MARHDFLCRSCGFVLRDYDVPVMIGARGVHLRCTGCGHRLEWRPAIGRMDFGPSAGAGFKAFTIEEEIRGETQRIEIDSLHKLRQVERESEQRARNGEGRPLVWRDLAQDRTNGDVHTLSKTPGDPHGAAQTLTAAKVPVTGRRGAAVTKDHGTL